MKKNLDLTKPRHSELILPIPWPFVISRFHCIILQTVTVKMQTLEYKFTRRLLYRWRKAEKPNFNLTTDNFSVKFGYNINIMGDKLLLNFWREIS